MTTRELNDAQKLFCEEYVANGYQNATKAYMAAYPNSTYHSANANAYTLLKNERVKAYLKEIQHDRLEALNVNADRIAEELSKLAFSKFDDNNSATSKLKALELLSKQFGLYTQKVDLNDQGNFVIKITNDKDEL